MKQARFWGFTVILFATAAVCQSNPGPSVGTPAGPVGSLQYNNNNVLGGGGLTTDTATGSNLKVPGVFLHNGPSATFAGANFGANTYFSLPCTASMAGDSGEGLFFTTCSQDAMLSLDPGYNSTSLLGNPQQYVPSLRSLYVYSNSTGVKNGLGSVCYTLGGGDVNCALNGYTNAKHAFGNAADEGVRAIGNHVAELVASMSGTAIAATNNATSVTVNCTANCINLGTQHPLVNTKTGISATATAVTPSGYGSYGGATISLLTFSGTPFTASNCAQVSGTVDVPREKINQKSAPQTISLVTPTAFGATFTGFLQPPTPSLIVIGGPNYWETTTVATATAFSGGNQTITAALTFPILTPGGLICSGGMAGMYAEQLAVTNALTPKDLKKPKPMYVFYVIGSPTTNTLLIAQNGPGYFQAPTLQPGTYNIYQGATVVDASGIAALLSLSSSGVVSGDSTGNVQVGLDQNTMTISTGDSLANVSLAGALYQLQSNISSVQNPYGGSVGIVSDMSYPGLNEQANFEALNEYDTTQLVSQGGMFYPHIAFLARSNSATPAPFGAGLFLQHYPVGGIFSGTAFPACFLCNFGSTLNSTKPFYIYGDFSAPSSSSYFHGLVYTPSSGNLNINMTTVELPSQTTIGTQPVCVAGGTGCQVPLTLTTNGTGAATLSPQGALNIPTLPLPLAGSVTTSTGPYDTFMITGITSASHCSFQATGSGAVIPVSISSKSTNSITVSHAATAGTYDYICTVY